MDLGSKMGCGLRAFTLTSYKSQLQYERKL